FQLPAAGLCDSRYRGMTAEEVFDHIKGLLGPEPLWLGFDLHLEPGDAEGLSQRGRGYPSADGRRRLRALIRNEMTRELRRRGRGTLPGELQRGADLATRTQVSWQQVLARFFSGLRRSDYRLFPFNKKHLWRQVYLPSLGIPGPDHLVLAVGTSGSGAPKELGEVVAELGPRRALTGARRARLGWTPAAEAGGEGGGGATRA